MARSPHPFDLVTSSRLNGLRIVIWACPGDIQSALCNVLFCCFLPQVVEGVFHALRAQASWQVVLLVVLYISVCILASMMSLNSLLR